MLQQVVSRNTDPLKTAILTVGTINGGTAINVIPDYVYAGGVFRYYDNDTAQVIKEHTMDIARGVESISGCHIKVTAMPGYRCVDNDGDMVDLCEEALKEELGDDAVFFMDEPASGSEDFSYYSLCSGIPCSFMWLNTAPITGTELSPLHSSKCAMSSEAIKSGAAGLASIAVKYLNK
jgi:amidohydrolase